MMQFLNEILVGFRKGFSREATFKWFVVIVAGLLVRTDHLGVTSVIRGLCLSVDYVTMIGFFRSSAWTLDALTERWCALVREHAPLARMGDSFIIVGDGVKQSKEGRKMPGVKRLHQESEDSSKGEYIWGHLFGGVGILAETAKKSFCIPLAAQIQDGVKTIFGWCKEGEQKERQGSHVVEMIRLANKATTSFIKRILLLDRLFLTVPALRELDKINAEGQTMEIVTKAKSNCTAFELPGEKTGKRGRPRIKGKKLKLFDLFQSAAEQFDSAEVLLYGKLEQVRYLCIDLLWGKGLYKKLRFVLVKYGETLSALVSTDLSMMPIDIIQLYGRRFAIEPMFREMKQVICAFGYRFWSKYMPKLNRYKKKTDPDPLEQVCTTAQKRIKLALKAIEGFVFCAIVATGLLQMISMRFSSTNELRQTRYLRTRRNTIASEATVADFFQKNFYRLLLASPALAITRIISEKQYAKYEPECAPHAPEYKKIA